MLQTTKSKLLVASAVMGTILGQAGLAFADPAPDPLTGTGGALETVRDQIVGYAGPIGLALVAIGVAFVAVKLIPRVIRMISSRLG